MNSVLFSSKSLQIGTALTSLAVSQASIQTVSPEIALKSYTVVAVEANPPSSSAPSSGVGGSEGGGQSVIDSVNMVIESPVIGSDIAWGISDEGMQLAYEPLSVEPPAPEYGTQPVVSPNLPSEIGVFASVVASVSSVAQGGSNLESGEAKYQAPKMASTLNGSQPSTGGNLNSGAGGSSGAAVGGVDAAGLLESVTTSPTTESMSDSLGSSDGSESQSLADVASSVLASIGTEIAPVLNNVIDSLTSGSTDEPSTKEREVSPEPTRDVAAVPKNDSKPPSENNGTPVDAAPVVVSPVTSPDEVPPVDPSTDLPSVVESPVAGPSEDVIVPPSDDVAAPIEVPDSEPADSKEVADNQQQEPSNSQEDPDTIHNDAGGGHDEDSVISGDEDAVVSDDETQTLLPAQDTAPQEVVLLDVEPGQSLVYMLVGNTNKLSKAETLAASHLDDLGYAIALVDSVSALDLRDLRPSDLLIATSNDNLKFQSSRLSQLRATPAKVLMCDTQLLKTLGFAESVQSASRKKITALIEGHSMLDRLGDSDALFTSSLKLASPTKVASSATSLAKWQSSSQRLAHVAVVYDRGSKMSGGISAVGHRIHIPCSDTAIRYYSGKGWDLFDAAVDYLAK